MFTKRTVDCPSYIAKDGCRIRELLHPRNEPLELSYSLAAASVEPGARTLRHKLVQSEVYYIHAGCGVMHIGEHSRAVMPGDVIIVPPAAEQWIENPGVSPLEYLVIVSPPWRAEDDTQLE